MTPPKQRLERISELGPGDFQAAVVDLWRRQGWSVGEPTVTGDVRLATRGSDERRECIALGLAWRESNDVVGGGVMRTYASLPTVLDVDSVVVPTNTAFSGKALEVAAAFGVDAIDRTELARIVDSFGAETLLE